MSCLSLKVEYAFTYSSQEAAIDYIAYSNYLFYFCFLSSHQISVSLLPSVLMFKTPNIDGILCPSYTSRTGDITQRDVSVLLIKKKEIQ